jgi:hypothetical protein
MPLNPRETDMRAGGLESVEMLNDDELDIVAAGQGAWAAAKEGAGAACCTQDIGKNPQKGANKNYSGIDELIRG